MRVLQGNLNRSRTAYHLLAQLCFEKKADIVLISEQYQNRAGVGCFADELSTAAIWILDLRLIHVSDQGSGRGYVWTTFKPIWTIWNTRCGKCKEISLWLETSMPKLSNGGGEAGLQRKTYHRGGVETGPISTQHSALDRSQRAPGDEPWRRSPCDVAIVAGWQVIEDYTGSDHQYILFDVHDRRPAVTSIKRPPRWNIARMDRERLSSVIEVGWRFQQSTSASLSTPAQVRLISAATMQLIQKTCAIAVPNTTSEETRPRRSSFGRRLSSGQSLEEDHQGQSTTVLEGAVPGCRPESVRIRPKREISLDAPGISGVPQFTEKELLRAASSMRNKKAPGPDGLSAELIKDVAQSHPELLLNMYNKCFRGGIFPAPWKKERLVLISKGKGPVGAASSYRSICMLDMVGKLLEKLINPRLRAAVKAAGDLAGRQYGFRSDLFTIHAVLVVVTAVKMMERSNHRTRPLRLLATLDVRNAFNPVSPRRYYLSRICRCHNRKRHEEGTVSAQTGHAESYLLDGRPRAISSSPEDRDRANYEEAH
ncbi:uncharacterized protein LOC118450807 [Vespa mandarinia]|uniref:uncharacterized protein LOC118450807 n=1 Tax=Vespa mandarinia TaxID=7446 RepID=UPI001617E2B1|nr:uncharacterized protein LOC118450807 [Vespa mandarinia]